MGAIQAVWRVVGWWMDVHHFSGLLGSSAVWKVNARIKRAFTAKSQEAVPAHLTNTNMWTVVTHSTIPTVDSSRMCGIAGTEERSQAQVPAESKNSAVPFNKALPSICCWGSYPAGFQVLMTPTAAVTVFWCAGGRSPEAPGDWSRSCGISFGLQKKLPFPAKDGGKKGGLAFRIMTIILFFKAKPRFFSIPYFYLTTIIIDPLIIANCQFCILNHQKSWPTPKENPYSHPSDCIPIDYSFRCSGLIYFQYGVWYSQESLR